MVRWLQLQLSGDEVEFNGVVCHFQRISTTFWWSANYPAAITFFQLRFAQTLLNFNSKSIRVQEELEVSH